MAMSDFLENGVLNHIFRGQSFPSLSGSVHVALFTAAPSDSGGGTEVSGNGYARVAVARDTDAWTTPTNSGGAQQTSNTDAISFPESTGAWGTVTHVGLFTASTGGNMLYHGELAESRNVDATGITIRIPAGSLTVSQS